MRLAAVDEDGKNFVDDVYEEDVCEEDVCEEDVWTFPTGVPHSIQALEQCAEFLLIFDPGEFNEDVMFLRNPIEVLSKNLKVDVSA